jgi:ABC-type molybdate transport system ATPase subunit
MNVLNGNIVNVERFDGFEHYFVETINKQVLKVVIISNDSLRYEIGKSVKLYIKETDVVLISSPYNNVSCDNIINAKITALQEGYFFTEVVCKSSIGNLTVLVIKENPITSLLIEKSEISIGINSYNIIISE